MLVIIPVAECNNPCNETGCRLHSIDCIGETRCLSKEMQLKSKALMVLQKIFSGCISTASFVL